MKQTLIVTIDMTDKTEAQLMKVLDCLFELPESREKRLKYNLVDIAQDDVIVATHTAIDVIYRTRKERR